MLITDRVAVVIGCGDTARLGTVHEASYEVLRTRRPATHTAEQARRMRGVLSGMSLPITVGDRAVGTVCLTGDPDEVRRFGLVVQRQAEILLEEAVLLLHERAVDDCVRDIALYDPEVVDAETVEARLAELGADPRIPRRAVVLDVRAGGVSRMSLLRTVREVFGSAQDVTGELAAGRYAVLHASTGRPERLVERCSALVERLGERHGADPRCGIGEPGRGVAGTHASYREAALALRAGTRLEPGRRVFAVAELRVPQLVASVVRPERARYAAALLGGLREREDWAVLRETLIAWAECGFQLVRTADRLAIHRNTLLYRLTKIEELTGRGVREPRTAMALYLACLADTLQRRASAPPHSTRLIPTHG